MLRVEFFVDSFNLESDCVLFEKVLKRLLLALEKFTVHNMFLDEFVFLFDLVEEVADFAGKRFTGPPLHIKLAL